MMNRKIVADSGLPENVNPFLAIWDECIDDGNLETIFPDYFYYNSPSDTPYAIMVKKPALSQTEAEALVRKLVDSGERRFAVQWKYKHIIPKDLQGLVRITDVGFEPKWFPPTKELVGHCRASECYYCVDTINIVNKDGR
ncbi:MAG: hypothetical protein HY226_00730 [Candidatus Vogelbacteria bacterium]|nr:hypothetical protein [Candidatus Vogelbacteria bacterium]